jgi:aryl-alcohol dehydrogenase-like predicted oxidoreductase
VLDKKLKADTMKRAIPPRLELHELSRIGFGSHLISTRNKNHFSALDYALRSGCNLIDTSANYMQGESEELIAGVLEQSELPAFVVTKSGYHQSEGAKLSPLLKKVQNNLIHPDFLANRLTLSRSRLKGHVDGYLLHNPEFCFQQTNPPDTEAFYSRIAKAFDFLEQQVKERKIRYYGISSNTMALSTSDEQVIRLKKVLSIAHQVSSTNHFRFIEFPFNLAEQEGLMPTQEGKSLANRPLNAYVPEGALRLAFYPSDPSATEIADLDADRNLFDQVLERIATQLHKKDPDSDVMDFLIIRNLKDNWMSIGNPQGVTELFDTYFLPFLRELYSGRINTRDKELYDRFYLKALRYAGVAMFNRTRNFYLKMVDEKILTSEDTRPLPVQACDYYLKSGINHVLTGMRSKKYVDELACLFRPVGATDNALQGLTQSDMVR